MSDYLIAGCAIVSVLGVLVMWAWQEKAPPGQTSDRMDPEIAALAGADPYIADLVACNWQLLEPVLESLTIAEIDELIHKATVEGGKILGRAHSMRAYRRQRTGSHGHG